MDENRAFAEKFSFPFDLLCDTDKAIGKQYGALDDKRPAHARRISYLIGPDGTVAHAFPSVNPKEHVREVLEVLRSPPS